MVNNFRKENVQSSSIKFKVNNGNNRAISGILSKLRIKSPERCYERASASAFIADVEQVNAG